MAREMLHAVDVEKEAGPIYQAVSTRDGLASFWTGDVDAESSVGSVARFGFPAAPVDLKMRIESLDPDKGVTWRCLGDFPNWKDTRVEWELSPSPAGHGTQVLFRHVGWGEDYPEIEYARVNWVWGQVVGRLKAFVESGEPAPFFPAPAVSHP
jgi:uncharacterized protein YndB with AHSA1/START domain